MAIECAFEGYLFFVETVQDMTMALVLVGAENDSMVRLSIAISPTPGSSR